MTKKAQTASLCPNPNIKYQWPRLDHIENLYNLGYEKPHSLPNLKLDLKSFCSARKQPIVHLPVSEKRETEITKTSETQITRQLKTHKQRPPCIKWHPKSRYQDTGSAESVLLAPSPTSPSSFIPTTQASLLSPRTRPSSRQLGAFTNAVSSPWKVISLHPDLFPSWHLPLSENIWFVFWLIVYLPS